MILNRITRYIKDICSLKRPRFKCSKLGGEVGDEEPILGVAVSWKCSVVVQCHWRYAVPTKGFCPNLAGKRKGFIFGFVN